MQLFSQTKGNQENDNKQNNHDDMDITLNDIHIRKGIKQSPARSSQSNIKVISNKAKLEMLDISPLLSSIRGPNAIKP